MDVRTATPAMEPEARSEKRAPHRPEPRLAARVTAGVAAAVLLVLAIPRPVWEARLTAPQYPGGLKSISQEKVMATRPERVVQAAIKGMLPHNAHGAKLLRHLKVYAGPDHPHQSQVNAGTGKGRQAQA